MPVPVSSEWLSLSQIAGGEMIALARMYYGDESAYVSLSSGEPKPALGTENFLDVLSADPFPRVIQELDMMRHSHSVQSLQLTIDNLLFEPGKRWSDLVEDTGLGAGADIGFYNRKIDIRAYLPGVTTFANCFPLLSNGIVRDIKHSREETVIEVEDRTVLTKIDVGTLLTSSDAADGVILPEESLGLSIPIILGTHVSNIGSTTASLINYSREHNFTKARYLGVDTAGKHRWQISDHQLENMVTDETDSDEIWALDPDTNRMMKLTAFDVEQNTSSGCIISVTDLESLYDFWYSDGSGAKIENNGGTVTNEENGYDLLVSTHATLNAHDADPAPQAGVQVNYPTYNNPITPDNKHLFVRGTFDNGNYDGNEEFLVGGLDAEGVSAAVFLDVGASGLAVDFAIQALLKGATDAAGAADINNARVYEIFKRVEFTPTRFLSVFSGVQGWELGTYFNGRSTAEDDPKRSGNFSETHQNDDDAGDLAENFASVIELIIREYISLVTAYIDENTFNVASNDLPVVSWKCSSALTEIVKGTEILFSLLTNCKSYLWWQPDGTIKMKVMEDTYAASDRALDARDVIDLRFDRTPARDIKTAVNVRYNLSGGRYVSATGISQDADQQSKYNVTEAQSTLIFEADHVGDSTTAGKLRTFLLAFLKQPHNIVKGQLGKNHLDLDLGDIIELSDVPYEVYGEDVTANATRNGQTIYKYWWVYHVERSDVMRFEAIQLHDLS